MKCTPHILATWVVGILLAGCTNPDPDWWKPKPRPAATEKPSAVDESLPRQLERLRAEKTLREEALNNEIKTLKTRVDELEFLNRTKTEDLRAQQKELREAKAYQGQAETYRRQAELLQQKVANLEAILNQLQAGSPATKPAPPK